MHIVFVLKFDLLKISYEESTSDDPLMHLQYNIFQLNDDSIAGMYTGANCGTGVDVKGKKLTNEGKRRKNETKPLKKEKRFRIL